MSDQVPADFTVGSVIAGYRLEQRIGHGGMAMVFRARDSRLDRQVALKILAPTLASDDEFRRRFIRESRAAAAVDDPHIIPVFDAGESDGVLFIAMRYVRGGDVRSLIGRTGPLPAERVAELVSQAASALDAAHAMGLVHRDVKPANMLLDASPVAGRPDHLYLSDFGLSKGALSATGLTSSGQFLGTLDYVPPEQIEGRRQLDGRSDQYALACSAFEMLCGEPPFRREHGVQVMYAHLSEPPPSVHGWRPDLPAAVDVVLSKALAKIPDDRYPTCRDFVAALRLALGLGLSAANSAGRTKAVRPSKRRRLLLASPGLSGSPAPTHRRPTDRLTSPRLPGNDVAPADAAAADAPAADQTDQISSPHPSGADLVADAMTGADHAAGISATGAWSAAQRGRRPWWRSPAPLVSLCVLALAAAGGGYALAGRGHPRHAGQTRTMSAALTVPGCTSTTAGAPYLNGVRTGAVTTHGSPFGVVAAPGGLYSFVTLGNSVAVLRADTPLHPTVVRRIPVQGAGEGAALTPDGHYLVAATGSGLTVISVARAEDGTADPVVGTLSGRGGSGAGAIEVFVTPGDGYAFVTLENTAELTVFNLRDALTSGFSRTDFIGEVPLPRQPVGLTSDGTYLYVASLSGKLTVVSLYRAEHRQPHAVVATVAAGCGAARALVSGHGKVIWVTDRGADALVAFSAIRLRTDRAHALLAKVMVGASPVGETLVDGGNGIVVADANLGDVAGQSTIAVVSTPSALSRREALLGYLQVGSTPRQFAVVPGGKTLLLTLQGARELEAVSVPTLPLQH